MRQTSFNLIAITIFLFTMASLLGPLLHLSPAVPAIATVTLLGLVTVDQLSFKGQGGNLLIGSLARFDPEHQQRIVHHEAGHFLTAYLLDIPIESYSLSAWEALRQGMPGQAGVRFADTALEAYLAQGQLPAQAVNRYSQVWLAGIAAEEMVYGAATGGEDDRIAFRALWQQLPYPPSEAAMRERWACVQAKTLLENHRSAYDALVIAMTQRTPVAECCQIIQAHLSTTAHS